MTVDDLLQRRGGWLESGPDEGPVISSRIRLARNLDRFHFPDRASKKTRSQLWKEINTALDALPVDEGVFLRWEMEELSAMDREVLFERHVISRELAGRKTGSGVAVRDDECVAIMVNEEDHLRIQSLQPGLDLGAAWGVADRIDNGLEKTLTYAFSGKLGYLTACPSNVGTGLRASVMLHLPGLVLTGEIKPVMNAVSKIGLAVRGLWGEGSEASGHMFQISNQITLGRSEAEIIAHLEQIVLEVIEHEKNARGRLLEAQAIRLHDHVGRAYGILANAGLMTTSEALDLLSALRLGADLKIFDGPVRREIDRLLIEIHPAHLQKGAGGPLSAEERDVRRAQRIRTFLQS